MQANWTLAMCVPAISQFRWTTDHVSVFHHSLSFASRSFPIAWCRHKWLSRRAYTDENLLIFQWPGLQSRTRYLIKCEFTVRTKLTCSHTLEENMKRNLLSRHEEKSSKAGRERIPWTGMKRDRVSNKSCVKCILVDGMYAMVVIP